MPERERDETRREGERDLRVRGTVRSASVTLESSTRVAEGEAQQHVNSYFRASYFFRATTKCAIVSFGSKNTRSSSSKIT